MLEEALDELMALPTEALDVCENGLDASDGSSTLKFCGKEDVAELLHYASLQRDRDTGLVFGLMIQLERRRYLLEYRAQY